MDKIVQDAIKAINEVFSDTTVSAQETVNRMVTISEEADALLDCAYDNPRLDEEQN